MHFVIKIFPEIFVKSQPVRKRMTQALANNLKKLTKPLDDQVQVIKDFEKIEVIFSPGAIGKQQAVQLLKSTPGVAKFSQVTRIKYTDLDHIAEFTLSQVSGRIANKTFVVRAKRSGCQGFSSVEVERQVGGYLLHHSEAAGVSLKQPDETVELEIREQMLFVLGDSWAGLGGFPLGTQESVLSLLSGGFDSSVSSYLTTKRGLVTHFLFFNLGGRAHEIGVKEVAHYLWERFSRSHRVNFITVPFAEVVSEIVENIPKSYMGVVLKRMMYRAADQIAAEYKFKAVVTGESVAQVSSQTLANLAMIDSISDSLILRPLITADKGEIINIAREIGTENFAANMPEYCGVISSRPTTAARKHIVEDAETSFDFAVLDKAIANHYSEAIDSVLDNINNIPVDIYSQPLPEMVLVDVRHPDEIANKPVDFGDNEVLQIPYYQVQKQFPQLDGKTTYLLYCDRGVMSRLHAELLIETGFRHVGVYRP